MEFDAQLNYAALCHSSWQVSLTVTRMSTIERAVGRPWTTDEDTLLRQAVATHGENDQWKAVALSVPGRTNKACRKVCALQYDMYHNPYSLNIIISAGFIHFLLLSRNRLGQQLRIAFF